MGKKHFPEKSLHYMWRDYNKLTGGKLMKAILSMVFDFLLGAVIIWLAMQVFIAIAPQTADTAVRIGKSIVNFLNRCAEKFDNWVASWSTQTP